MFIALIALMTSSLYAQTGIHTGKAFKDHDGTTYFRYDTNKVVVVYYNDGTTTIGIRTYYPNSEYMNHGMFAHWEWLPDMKLTVSYGENAPEQNVLAKFGGMVREEKSDVPGHFCVVSVYSIYDYDWHDNNIKLRDKSGKLVYAGPLNSPW